MKNKINIVITLDDNYFKPAFLLLNSIIKTNQDEEVLFYCIYETLSEKYCTLFKSLENEKIKINLLEISTESLQQCPIRQNDHVTLATYYRILLPNLLPLEVEKVLYLDCDMLCFGNLHSLFNTNIDGFSLGASFDSQCQNENRKLPLNLKKETNYFGAGMLLINLKYWRQNNIMQKCLEYISGNGSKLLWHDQDTLNVICEGTVKTIDFKYNFYETFFKVRSKSIMNDILWEKAQNDKFNICILHYTQAEKPWFFECEHPLKNIYRMFYYNVFHKKLTLKFKYKGKQRLSFIKRKILSKLFSFPMNASYENIPDKLVNELTRKLIPTTAEK